MMNKENNNNESAVSENKVETNNAATKEENIYCSVTIDFLRAINSEWDVDNNNNHLLAALRLVGIDVTKKVDKMESMFVRYVHAPLFSRETTIYQGKMVQNYPFKNLYKNVEILDVNIKNDLNIEVLTKFLTEKDKNGKLVSDFDFVDESYYIPEGGKEFKNQYISKQDKVKYSVFNKNDEELEELLQREEIFHSPFDIEEDK